MLEKLLYQGQELLPIKSDIVDVYYADGFILESYLESYNGVFKMKVHGVASKYSFGDNTLDEKYISNRLLMDRIFSCNNAADIEEIASFLSLYNFKPNNI